MTAIGSVQPLETVCLAPLEGAPLRAMGWVEFDVGNVACGEYKLWATIGNLRNLG